MTALEGPVLLQPAPERLKGNPNGVLVRPTVSLISPNVLRQEHGHCQSESEPG
jgi:hypothetical protein